MPEVVTNTLSALRAGKGMTQEELAKEAGVSRQTIIAMEKGNYAPSVLLALKIARIFRRSVEDIFRISHAK